MIDKALLFLQEYITAMFTTHGVASSPQVMIASLPKDPDLNADDKIYVTLINIEEERVLKNLAAYRPLPAPSTQIALMNPEIRINMYVLVSAQFKKEDYVSALKFVSLIISFFQGKEVFETDDFTAATDASPVGSDFSELEKLVVELYSPTFDQNNQIWPTLGSKLVPSVIYKVRMVAIADKLPPPVRSTYVVEGIDIGLNLK